MHTNPCSAQHETGLAAIDGAWAEWSERIGVDELNDTEVFRFFGYLAVERPELLMFSTDQKTKWQVVLGYLKWSQRKLPASFVSN
jgi:hypothetical protein